MNAPELKTLISSLNKRYLAMTDPPSLQEYVRMAYGKMVLSSLDRIFTEHTGKPPAELFHALEVFLSTNWSLTKGTSVSYTAIPTDEVTCLLCDVAQFVATETQQNPLQLLMPTVSLESLNPTDKYPHLNQPETNSQFILKTHISSSNQHYLIPVASLSELSMSPKTNELTNNYLDIFEHEQDEPYLNKEERSRLAEHSVLTRAMVDAKREYDLLASDTSTLLGQLNQLCRQLNVNSAAYAGGIGKEDNAGMGAYSAIINFMEYYEKLGVDNKSNIPAVLKKEIDLLLALSSDKTQNKNAVKTIATCIATRRSQLISTMSGHEASLNLISVSQNKKQSLINEAKSRFSSAQKELSDAIDSKMYAHGNDKLGLSVELLDILGVSLKVLSLSDLAIIQSLSAEEITSVLSKPELRQQVVTQIKSIENLVMFATETPSERLSAFFTSMRHELSTKLIQNPDDLSALLISLDAEKCQVICTAMKDTLPNILKSSGDFTRMIKQLSAEQCVAVYASMKDALPNFIKSPNDFISMIERLSAEQCAAVCTAMKDTLPNIIKSSTDFRFIMARLSEDQCVAVYPSMKDALPNLIESAIDFYQVMAYLSSEQRTALYSSLKDALPNFIKSVYNFYEVMAGLSSEQRAEVYTSMKDALPNFIKSAVGFNEVMVYLSEEQRTEVLSTMKDNLPSLIKSGHDFNCVVRNLSAEQRTEVYTTMKDTLPNFIKSAWDFNEVMEYLSSEQRAALYTTMQDTLPNIMKSTGNDLEYELLKVVYHLSSENRWGLLVLMQPSLNLTLIDKGFMKDVLEWKLTQQMPPAYQKIFNRKATASASHSISLLEYIQTNLLGGAYDINKIQKVFDICKALDSSDEQSLETALSKNLGMGFRTTTLRLYKDAIKALSNEESDNEQADLIQDSALGTELRMKAECLLLRLNHSGGALGKALGDEIVCLFNQCGHQDAAKASFNESQTKLKAILSALNALPENASEEQLSTALVYKQSSLYKALSKPADDLPVRMAVEWALEEFKKPQAEI